MKFDDPTVQAAIIGAVVALITFAVKDLIFQPFRDKFFRNQERTDVYDRYTAPIGIAATALLWRLKELFLDEERGTFLIGSQVTSFIIYKRESTAYRIATLLGWMRAFSRELSALNFPQSTKHASFKSTLEAIEGSLADGTHIENKRLKDLCTLWNISFQQAQHLLTSTATAIDNELDRFLHDAKTMDPQDLTHAIQRKLCIKIAILISVKFKTKAPDTSVIKETQAQAIQVMTYKQAWIYRDVQSAIGDAMISETSIGLRRYEIKGYADFCSMLQNSKSLNQPYLSSLTDLLENVDVTTRSQYDARVEQLFNLFQALAYLVLGLYRKNKNSLITLKTKLLAEKVIEIKYSSTSNIK